MKKRIKLTAAVLSLVFSLTVFPFIAAGCDEEKPSIYVVTMFGGTDAHKDIFETINAEFERNTGITVENNSSGSNTTWQINVRNSFLLEKTTPDVLYYFNGTAANSIHKYLVPVEEILEVYHEEDNKYGKDISVQINDEYCLPFKGFTEGIIYRDDYFDEADFSDYNTLKNKIISYKNDDLKRVSAGYDIPHYWVNYLMTLFLGAEEFAAFDGTKGFFDREANRIEKWTNALSFTVSELKEMDICTNPDRTEGSVDRKAESQHFFEGRRGLLVDGSWQAGNMTNASTGVKEKLDVTGFPLNGTGGTPFSLSGFTSGWFITRKAWDDPEKRDAAVKYVMQHTSAESIDRYCQEAGGIPATGLPVTGASDAVNKFSGLLDGGVMSVTPIDDRMPDAAKTLFYGTSNGIPSLILGNTTQTVSTFFDAFYNLLNEKLTREG